jgi:glutaredoxin
MSWTSLFRWLRRPAPSLGHLHFVVYTRQGCHLCQTAWQLLEGEQRHFGFQLEAVDVDTDPVLVEQYGLTVPVVAVNGRVRFRGGVNDVLLRRLLRAEQGQVPKGQGHSP